MNVRRADLNDNPALKRLIRKRNRLYKKWLKSRNAKDREAMLSLKRLVQRRLRQDYWAHTEKLITEENQTGSNKRFWAYVKAKSTQRSNIAPLKVDGRLIHNAKDKGQSRSP